MYKDVSVNEADLGDEWYSFARIGDDLYGFVPTGLGNPLGLQAIFSDVDYGTFKPIGGRYAADKSAVFHSSQKYPLVSARPDNFLVKEFGRFEFGISNDGVYHDGKLLDGIDPESMVVDEFVVYDENTLWRDGGSCHFTNFVPGELDKKDTYTKC